MKKISTQAAPQPAGHYSQAVVCGGVVYVAGQLGAKPGDRSAPPGGVAEQTRQALANVAAILEEAGSGLQHVLQMTIYVTDMALWGDVNEAYAEVLGDHKPARAVVPVGPLHGDFVLEVQAIAALP